MEASRIKDKTGKSIGGIAIIQKNTDNIPNSSTSDRSKLEGQLRHTTNSRERYLFANDFIKNNNITQDNIQISNPVYDMYKKKLEPNEKNNDPESYSGTTVLGRRGNSIANADATKTVEWFESSVDFVNNPNTRIKIFVDPNLRPKILSTLRTYEGFSEARIEWLDAPLNDSKNTGEVNYIELMNDHTVTH